jgi:rhodanese-related sulfurtransferase
MTPISAPELAHWLADPQRPRPLLLDVREPWEQQVCSIEGSEPVPMRSVPERVDALDPTQPVVCICHHGRRSAHVALYLVRQGFADVYNLTGGVDAWAREVDSRMAVY